MTKVRSVSVCGTCGVEVDLRSVFVGAKLPCGHDWTKAAERIVELTDADRLEAALTAALPSGLRWNFDHVLFPDDVFEVHVYEADPNSPLGRKHFGMFVERVMLQKLTADELKRRIETEWKRRRAA